MIEKKISRSKAPLCVALISSTRHKNGEIKLKKTLKLSKRIKRTDVWAATNYTPITGRRRPARNKRGRNTRLIYYSNMVGETNLCRWRGCRWKKKAWKINYACDPGLQKGVTHVDARKNWTRILLDE